MVAWGTCGALHAAPHAGVAYDLWMYDWKPLTAKFQVMSLDFSQPPPAEVSVGADSALGAGVEEGSEVAGGSESTVDFVCEGTCHAVVMWLDWSLDRCQPPSHPPPHIPPPIPPHTTPHIRLPPSRPCCCGNNPILPCWYAHNPIKPHCLCEQRDNACLAVMRVTR